MDNNPVNLSDPTGTSAGDYYDTDGKTYLGNDGKKDGKVYKSMSNAVSQKASNMVWGNKNGTIDKSQFALVDFQQQTSSQESTQSTAATSSSDVEPSLYSRMQGSDSGELPAPFKSAGLGVDISSPSSPALKIRLTSTTAKSISSTQLLGNYENDGYLNREEKIQAETGILSVGGTANTLDIFGYFVVKGNKTEHRERGVYYDIKLVNFSFTAGNFKATHAYKPDGTSETKIGLTTRAGLEFKASVQGSLIVGYTEQIMK